MNQVRKLYCRAFQAVFKIALPVLPYRKPKLAGSVKALPEIIEKNNCSRVLIITDPGIQKLRLTARLERALKDAGMFYRIYGKTCANPTTDNVYEALELYRENACDAIIGFGGGSSMDCAKAVGARIVKPNQSLAKMKGILKVHKRLPLLIAVPTTAGTGSEVSPNAILLDERDRLKKGIVSPYLLADTAYVDPMLTMTVPSKVTADTGMDALTHCIEAYTNKFAHPAVDIYALQGIKLIAANLLRAVRDGNDTEAREAMPLGSLYGGLVLGPVNTAAVDALSYPLGGEFHIPHGLSNAILLPSVMKFNRPANLRKYAEVAIACGAPQGKDDNETAQNGVDFIYELSKAVGIPQKLSDLNIPQSAVDGMAKAAMEVQRLLKNNPREVTEQDARDIYNSLY